MNGEKEGVRIMDYGVKGEFKPFHFPEIFMDKDGAIVLCPPVQKQQRDETTAPRCLLRLQLLRLGLDLPAGAVAQVAGPIKKERRKA